MPNSSNTYSVPVNNDTDPKNKSSKDINSIKNLESFAKQINSLSSSDISLTAHQNTDYNTKLACHDISNSSNVHKYLLQNIDKSNAENEEEKSNNIPHNISAEQILIGSILINNQVLNDVHEFLLAKHFYDSMHQKIYQSILILVEQGITAHHISLHQHLAHDAICEFLKKENYLLKLTTLAAAVYRPIEYAQMIHNLSLRRELMSIGKEIAYCAMTSGLDNSAIQQIEKAESQLFNLVTDGTVDKSFIQLKHSVAKSINHIKICRDSTESLTGITSGFQDLDNVLSGFHNSDLLILAARPGMGKTTLALNFAFNAAEYFCKGIDENRTDNGNEHTEQKSIGIFSLEMHAEQLSTKLMAMSGEVDSSKILSGKLTEREYNNLRAAAGRLSILPIFIDDTPALSINAIRTRARRLKRKKNLSFLLIDYLQLVRPSNSNSQNRVLEISEITQSLKALAKELNIPIMALSQLSRAVEQRTDKRPMLSDLRESGSIEQDADIVMFIYREDYYLANKGSDYSDQMEEVRNQAEIIISKHRNGRTGIVKLGFNPNSSQFANFQSKAVL